MLGGEWFHVSVTIFFSLSCLASPSQGQTDILQEVMTEVAGRTFVAQDPDDGMPVAFRS